MKKKIEILLIVLSLSCFIVAIYLKLFNKEIKQDENIEKENNNVEVKETNSYKCSKEKNEWSGVIENKNVSFTVQNHYYFTYGAEGLSNIYMQYEYIFPDIGNYNSFEWSENSSSVKVIRTTREEENLTKKYDFYIVIPDDENNLEKYLKKVEKSGYTCTKTS